MARLVKLPSVDGPGIYVNPEQVVKIEMAVLRRAILRGVNGTWIGTIPDHPDSVALALDARYLP